MKAIMVACVMLVGLTGAARAQEQDLKVTENWKAQGWGQLLHPQPPEGMPITWAQGYWKVDPQAAGVMGTGLTVQIQFRNDMPQDIASIHMVLLLQYPDAEDYEVAGLSWPGKEEDPLAQFEVIYSGWLVLGQGLPNLEKVQNVIILPPCSVTYADGSTWSPPAPAENEADYCARVQDVWFPAGFHHRMGVVKPQEP